MAINLTYSQIFVSQDYHFSCDSLSPSYLLNLRRRTPKIPLKIHSKPFILTQISLQEQTQTSNAEVTQTPDEKTNSSSKSYVWVNPKSSRARQLRKTSYDFRYSSVVKITESLDSCSPVEADVFRILDGWDSKRIEEDVVLVLNNMSNAETAYLVLKYFQEKAKFEVEVILYNVTLKVFRKCKDLTKSENLFNEMIERGVRPDNVTFSTIISCARQCSLPEKAVEWFEKMPSFQCEPDGVIYSIMIDSYGKTGNVEMALSLYYRARTEKWRIDALTFSTLIKIYGTMSNYDGCLNVYEEMKAIGIRPSALVYNNLLEAMGRAKRPWQAKNIYKDMLSKGLEPTWGTYAALIRGYSKARYGEDALAVYREMKQKGLQLSVVLYNTLLSLCANVGFIDEAVEIFQDMKNLENCTPDSWTYCAMITIFSCNGKVLEAEQVLNEMLGAGFEPTIYILTSLIQCYGKANRTDDVVRTFDWLLELGIAPDERFCACLLNVMTQLPKEEIYKLIGCVEKANLELGHVVKLLIQSEDIEGELIKKEARQLLDNTSADVRKAYCNCLIDICVNLNMLERACELLELGITLEIYTNLQSRTPTQWSLHLKSLSLGAALTSLHIWMNDLSRALENEEELPLLLGINTGHGKHKYSEKGLAGVFESHLKELNAPFHEAPDKVGWFLTTNVAATSWLKSRQSATVAAP